MLADVVAIIGTRPVCSRDVVGEGVRYSNRDRSRTLPVQCRPWAWTQILNPLGTVMGAGFLGNTAFFLLPLISQVPKILCLEKWIGEQGGSV